MVNRSKTSTYNHTGMNKIKSLSANWFLDKISENFKNIKIGLNFDKNDPWQLLVAVILSAQTKDESVNNATFKLFSRFKDVYSFARAKYTDIEPYIKNLGIFRVKSKNLVETAKILVKNYNGFLPKTRRELELLPGVGIKTSAVIVSEIFKLQVIAVDTHVARVSRRLGITKHKKMIDIEKELTILFDNLKLIKAHHVLILHGRKTCKARNPRCFSCPVKSRCPKILI